MRTTMAWLALCAAAVAQITVPPESDPYKFIEASVASDIPSGATLEGGWKLPPLLDHRKINRNTVYMVAPPGEYLLGFSGFWVHLGPEITVKDVDGVEHTFQPYLGHGIVDESASFKVVGGVAPDPPDPPGPDPPSPDQKYQMMFFLEADQLDKMPRPQREIVTSLVNRKRLADLGHQFLMVVDDDQITEGVPPAYQPWIDSVINDPLPRIAIAPVGGGAIADYPMPSSFDDLLRMMENPQKWIVNRLVRKVNK